MNNQERIKSAQQFMENIHQHDFSGHDIAHVYRVTSLAEYIAEHEHVAQPLVITLAALLHDTVDDKLVDSNIQLQSLTQFLQTLDLSQDMQQHILHIIQHMSYNNGQNNHVTLSIEGQIVRDADRLDAIGAIGIARTFQFAGHFNEPMWTEQLTDAEMAHQDVNQLPPSAIKHFYEKLFKLKDLIHTTTARHIAQQRHQFMASFVKQFLTEWNHSKD
ncbi:HD domain-containing protein [Staphylococcus simiae]|uniref:HD/PDEase domain-containing protein n=1 Tax=Staphylococcus simiae CCM 7213 = CCUG 51256 TaxID=911238 RepID=G5JKX7_9STAP|nr:HD domain-containing protein [Staphylococcus simiae]EHJ07182.1 hypothetical protein SS7213T_10694 [Staphylococcus simiae CCM 7213 = CCUG 51256]PNZ11146.1 HD domain-containing protein [Staphylococcus simiae]SNV76983.1 HD domain-containing protein [Staphylococcus simiae]